MSDPTNEIQHAELDWDQDGQPLSRAFGDVYFSRTNGLDETRHVFLHHNQLAERFARLTPEQPVFTIGETGFGSGLNFLATWQLWLTAAPAAGQLHFVSVEKFPLAQTDLKRVLALWPELNELTQALLAQYPVFVGNGFHRLIFAGGRVTLTLIIDDAAAGFARWPVTLDPQFAHLNTSVNAWFLDGFAPSKNPHMWRPELFNAIALLSRAGTTAATFSAAGLVKQGLRSAGFSVRKVPGYGRKREMVSAVKEEPSAVTDTSAKISPPANPISMTPVSQISPGHFSTPWALVRDPLVAPDRTAVVIGGGLAGCHTARALAQRGWQVTLIERKVELAQAASGNPQGVLYAKLSPRQEPLAAFNLTCLQFALRHYAPYWRADQGIGSACGVLQLADSPAELALQAQLLSIYAGQQALVRFVDKDEAGQLAGVELQYGGLYFPDAGWLNPQRLCHALVNHPNIQLNTRCEALALARDAHQWRVSNQQQQVASANVLVIANAVDALAFEQTDHLPLKTIRGQVTYLPATTSSRALKTVVCGEGYIAPATALAGSQLAHCAGATFNLNDQETGLRARDHQTNLAHLAHKISALAPEWQGVNPGDLDGRVAFRCATSDYLPVVGPAPKREAFLVDYAALRKDARRGIPLAGQYWPGLYLNIGHGSRGLAYTPLCAELLAAQINQEPLPLGQELAQALHPARFIIRDLQRNRC